MPPAGRPEPEAPGPGQESVWDYPRPPDVQPTAATLRVVFAGTTVAQSAASWRVLETSHPPTYYLPIGDFLDGVLRRCPGSSWCEWKGQAAYLDLVADGRVARAAAWTYPQPTPAYRMLRGHVAVMPGAVDACYVDGEWVRPQDGGFYGGWITSRVVGPFKGGPGTHGW